MTRPIPSSIGVGVSAFGERPEYAALGLDVRPIGRYWNYHFTTRSWKWPDRVRQDHQYVIDGFSPNLNKELHIGHLRNLVVATSLSRIFPNAKMVALLGAAVGIEPWAVSQLETAYQLAGYRPVVFYDTQLPDTVECVDGEGEQVGCKVWVGPKGPVIVKRADGRPTYAHHDLEFSKLAHVTHYITGAEQREHFESLGFGDRHLPMGLVLGPDGKKVSSRMGGVLTLRDALLAVEQHLKDGPENPTPLAWNVLAWNFLKIRCPKNVQFDPEEWTRTESPGMYISYTYARLDKALGDLRGDEHEILEADVRLLGVSSYLEYYLGRAVETMDPNPIAHYALDLATVITEAYHAEKIQGGRPGRQFAMWHAHRTLGRTMSLLGMKPLSRV